MRILYLSQYFPPETGATQTRAHEMARNLVRLGHQVTVIGEFPNHPRGVIPPEYRGKIWEQAKLDGIDVIRVWVKASPIKTFHNRMLFYLTYMVTAALAGLLQARGKYDLIYASSPPLFVGATALFLSTLRQIPLAFEVRDLWPESAVALGEMNNRSAIAWATRLEEACYRRARLIVVVTQGIRDRLLKRGIPKEKIVLIPNGANVELFNYLPGERDCLRKELGVEDKFVAIYAGIHGIAQGLETVVEAARTLENERGFHFFLMGEGPEKSKISRLIQEYGLKNIQLLEEQQRESMPIYLSAADAALIPLKNVDLFKGALPSKMFDAWACERPVVLSVDGEARQVLEEAQAGIYVPPENPLLMAKALMRLRDHPEECAQMGKNGRTFTQERYSRRALAETLERELAQLIEGKS